MSKALVTLEQGDPLTRRMRLSGIAVVVAVVVFVPAACGQNFVEVQVGDSSDGQTVHIHVDDVLKVTLDSTLWTFAPSSDPSILEVVGEQTVIPDPKGSCYPGSGCGVTTGWYKAMRAGNADITATRTSCGEAMRCTGDRGVYRVKVVVVAG